MRRDSGDVYVYAEKKFCYFFRTKLAIDVVVMIYFKLSSLLSSSSHIWRGNVVFAAVAQTLRLFILTSYYSGEF